MSNVNNPTSPLASEITTQNDVTASRNTTGGVYQNTNTKPMFVSETSTLPTTASATAYSDSAANPTTIVAILSNANLTAQYFQICFWVLPGNYYKITGNQTPVKWFEYV